MHHHVPRQYTHLLQQLKHREHVHEVLGCLWKHGLYAKADKCEWHGDSVELLGYMLSADSFIMSVDKVQTVVITNYELNPAYIQLRLLMMISKFTEAHMHTYVQVEAIQHIWIVY
jgi:hypothetical protein